MNRFSPAGRESPELRLPPMIDMVFLLNIFFMTATEFTLSQAEFLHLPVADQAQEQKQQPAGWVVINVRKDGSLSVRGADQDLASLPNLLANEVLSSKGISGASELSVLIRADGDTPTGAVQKVIKECVGLGIYRINFAALKQRTTMLRAKQL